jgi:enoyl reductase-like protein
MDISAREFLSMGYRLDRRIGSKLEQIQSLRELAMKANAVLSNMPSNATKNFHRMENAIAKMVDLETEINTDIIALVNLKKSIISAIKSVNNPEFQTLLELRYLSFKSWEEIAVDLHYSIHYLYKKHGDALDAFDRIFKKDDTK